jgi:hypothetical protein
VEPMTSYETQGAITLLLMTMAGLAAGYEFGWPYGIFAAIGVIMFARATS